MLIIVFYTRVLGLCYCGRWTAWHGRICFLTASKLGKAMRHFTKMPDQTLLLGSQSAGCGPGLQRNYTRCRRAAVENASTTQPPQCGLPSISLPQCLETIGADAKMPFLCERSGINRTLLADMAFVMPMTQSVPEASQK